MNTIYKSKKLILFFTILLFQSSQLFSQINKDTVAITKVVRASNVENTCFTISNSSDSLSIFSLKLNNNFYSSTKEITDEIKRLAGSNDDSLCFYAWVFLCSNSYSHVSLTNELWTTSLALYFNSIGFNGYNEQAIILTKLWNLLGYKTRIWQLDGHIVPEVLNKNNWQMFDPQFHVCYLNDSNRVAGVKVLVSNPHWLEEPNRAIISNETQYFGKYISRISKYYNSAKLIEEKAIPDIVDNFFLYLPPHATLVFPGVFVKDMKSNSGNPIKFYANCKLIIPPSWKGSIKNSLVIAKIDGKGRTRIDNKEYQIGSSELDSLITKHDKFISEIVVNNSLDSLEIIYLMNAYMSEIREENTITLSGKNIDGLEIGSVIMPDSTAIPKLLKKRYFYNIKKRHELLIEEIHENIPCVDTSQISTKEMFRKQLSEYLNCIYKGEKGEYITKVLYKIDTVISQLPKDYSFDRIFFFINNMPKVILFYDFEHGSPEDILVLCNLYATGYLK